MTGLAWTASAGVTRGLTIDGYRGGCRLVERPEVDMGLTLCVERLGREDRDAGRRSLRAGLKRVFFARSHSQEKS